MRSYTEELASPVVTDSVIPSGAGFGIRFLARLIDLIYGFLLGIVAGIVSGIFLAVLAAMGRIGENWPQLLQEKSYAGVALGILGAFLYHTFSEGLGGTSIGKLICGLNVVQTDGRPCTMLGAFKRDLLYHGDALFFGLVGYQSMKDSALRQRYGDHWAKTVVVKKGVYRPDPARSALRIVLGIVLGSMFWMSATCAQMLIQVL